MHTIDADLPDHRSPVKFRNFGPCMVISADKAASDAKNFREAARLIHTGTERGKMVSIWLDELADKYERLGAPDGA